MTSESPHAYLPTDRLHALATGTQLPLRTHGAALFADISGFTPLTEALVAAHGPQRGAEELPVQLNRIYDALVADVDRRRGSVLAFSGDAITCWFDESGDGGWGDGGRPSPTARAVATAMAMQATMDDFATLDVPGDGRVELAIKVAVATGPVRRFVVGDGSIHLVDVLAGDTLQRLAAAEHQADRGDVVIDQASVDALGATVTVEATRVDPDTGVRFAVVTAQQLSVRDDPWPAVTSGAIADDVLRPWLLPPVAARLSSDQGEFLTELRPAVALFLCFDGIDYDGDPAADQHLDAYLQAVQRILLRYDSYLLQLTIGDKGSYLYTSFGAPIAHEDDAERAVAAALELRDLVAPPVSGVRIGISRGLFRTGAYGGVSRRTYGVLGDEVNLAARLMQAAPPGEVLVDATVRDQVGARFGWEARPPLTVKGKSRPVTAFRLVDAARTRRDGIHEPGYATPMVGRDDELAILIDRLALARVGLGQVVALVAEAGMGKSRLVSEVIRLVRGHGVSLAAGACQSFGTKTRYLVWREVWRSLFGIVDDLPVGDQLDEVERRLADVDPSFVARLPLLGPVLGVEIDDTPLTASLDAKLRKASLEALLVEVVRRLASEQPVVIVLEDCHWMDDLSEDLLDAVVRATTDVAVLVVIAHRPDPIPRLRVDHLDHYTRLELADMAGADIAELIVHKTRQAFSPDTRIHRSVLDEIASRAQGNPFYVEEFLNYLRHHDVDPGQRDALSRIDLPSSLHSLVLSRIDQLTEDQQAALKVASVIGRLFRAAMVWGIQHNEDPDRQRDLDALTELDLTTVETPTPELTYLFKHVLTQEVAYETLPFATRAAIHGRIGRYIEETERHDLDRHLDLLAHHYGRSDDTDKYRDYGLRAGRAAQAAFANDAAIAYFEQVLPLLDDAERVGALVDLGSVHELVGDWAAAGEAGHDALAQGEVLGDLVGVARARRALGSLARKRGDYDDAVAWLTAARDTYADIADHEGESHAMSDLGELLRLRGDFDAARDHYRSALDLADGVTDDRARRAARAHALKGAGTVATWSGDYAAAEAANAEALDLLHLIDDRPGIAVLLNNQGIVARFLHDFPRAQRCNEESVRVFRELGDRWSLAQLLNNQACIECDEGNFATARAQLAESLTIRRQLGDRAGLALSLNTLADVLIDEGDPAGAIPLLDESLEISRELGDQTAIAYIVEDYAAVAAAHGDAERALRLGGYATGLRDAIGAPLPPAEQARVDRLLAPARSGDLDVAAVWQDGRRLGAAHDLDSAFEPTASAG